MCKVIDLYNSGVKKNSWISEKVNFNQMEINNILKRY